MVCYIQPPISYPYAILKKNLQALPSPQTSKLCHSSVTVTLSLPCLALGVASPRRRPLRRCRPWRCLPTASSTSSSSTFDLPLPILPSPFPLPSLAIANLVVSFSVANLAVPYCPAPCPGPLLSCRFPSPPLPHAVPCSPSLSVKDIRLHVYRKGFDPTYMRWKWHGELENPCSSSYTHNEQVENDIHDIHNFEVEMEDELGATQDVPLDQVVIDEERMADEQKKKKVRDAGKCEKLYKRKREGHPPIELKWECGEPRELAASQATTTADIAGSSTETGSQLGREDSWLREAGTAEHPGRMRGFGSYSGLRKVSKGNMKLAAVCYLRISDLANYIVAHGSVFSRAQETMADHEGSFVAWPKSLVGLGDPPVHTARHGDFSSSKSRHILGVCPTASPSSPVLDVVDRSSYVSFGPRCRELCQADTHICFSHHQRHSRSRVHALSGGDEAEDASEEYTILAFPAMYGLTHRWSWRLLRERHMPQLKARPDWIDVLEVPQQLGGVECGYYTMQFLWLIVNMCAQCSLPLYDVFQSTSPYTRAELEEVREF
ncbi:unnamed protein product [Cuscuta campestris]|uniref:Ubiquitin-like protease family profile domain-containing protein n=1 Tax=Cuscuta campestris TaxID=132261 RepID=A0A484L8D5_9ASTE|nr:unnamed protein product [Cuscuta campestris]